jgi:hypothetical protein
MLSLAARDKSDDLGGLEIAGAVFTPTKRPSMTRQGSQSACAKLRTATSFCRAAAWRCISPTQ